MTDAAPRPSYTARCTEDLLAMVPYLLGFHPEDSVVVLTFGAPEESFHARVDLPTDHGHQREVARLLQETLTRHRVPRAAVVVYSCDVAAAQSQAGALVEALDTAGVDVVELVRTDGRRWFPAPEMDGAGTAYDLAAHPFTAERVYHGDVVLGSRRELAESLVAPPDDATTRAAEAHLDRARAALTGSRGAELLREEARWVQQRIRRHLRDRAPLGPDDAGRLLALTGLVQVRDVAWSEMTRRTASQHVVLWRDLVRRCPADLLPGAGSLLAFAAWLAGHGALAWCALDRVLEVDPAYSMAHCVAECLTGALPPSVWTPVPEHQLPVFAGGA